MYQTKSNAQVAADAAAKAFVTGCIILIGAMLMIAGIAALLAFGLSALMGLPFLPVWAVSFVGVISLQIVFGKKKS